MTRAADTSPARDAAPEAGANSGADAGLPDEGLPDGGLPDGGLPDGGLPDADLVAPRPAGGRTRRLNEAKILSAAEAVFAEAGYNGASMQAIAERAGLPKANLHYYFGTKETLYRTLLSRILDMWVEAFDHIQPDRDPAEALAAYIRDKMTWSRTRPLASKVFANEIVHGAQQIEGYLSEKLRRTVEEKGAVIQGWIAAGRMAEVDPRHLFFVLWAATQTYADFEAQVRAVLGSEQLGPRDWQAATDEVTRIVLRGCGLEPPGTAAEEAAQ